MAATDTSSFTYPKTVTDMLALSDIPVVTINQQGLFTFINDAFEIEYGWKREELLNKSVTKIMPAHMRKAHNVGFARFLTTEQSELLGTSLMLDILYKDGRIEVAEHYILGDKAAGEWRFGSLLRRLS